MKIGKIKYSLPQHSYLMFHGSAKMNEIFDKIQFIPSKIEREYIDGDQYVVYTGTSESFDDINEGDSIPEYVIDHFSVQRKTSTPPKKANLGKFKLMKEYVNELPHILKTFDIFLTDVREEDDYFLYYGMSSDFESGNDGKFITVPEYSIIKKTEENTYSLEKIP